MSDRAYSTIAVKALDEDQRTFSGLATSPVPDRVLDVIEPMGCKYKNPTVLLRAHDHQAPIGSVTFDRPTKAGITFTAHIPKIPEPGLLRDRVDMAWGEIKHGLCRAVSVGFRPLQTEALPSGGLRFLKSEIYELSTVAVPAQELATIDQVKAIDAAVRRGDSPATASGAVWDLCSERGQKALVDSHAEWLAMTSAERKQTGFSCETMFLQDTTFQMLKFLADRIEGIERQGPAYKGIWKPQTTYKKGSFVSHAGSMWHADETTDFKPGEGGGWTLAVKRGADAR